MFKPENRRWLNLALLALLVFYLLYTLGSLWAQGLFSYVAIDYRAFWASAEIVLERGFAAAYDLDLQEQYQRPLYERYRTPTSTYAYATAPMYYLPPFILPMLWLPLLPPLAGFVLWTLLNLLSTVLYLYRFQRALGDETGVTCRWWPLLLAFPLYANLFFGQISHWLLLFVGECFLACRREKPFRAGLWLGGLLLKPQLLLLLLPGLLFGRRFKLLAGLALAGLLVLLLSLVLAGQEGLLELGRLLFFSLDSSEGLATNNPQLMINWRSLAVNLAPLLPDGLDWGLAGAGLLGTASLCLWLWHRARKEGLSSPQFALLLLATYSAACSVAWHSHIHMLLPLLPLLFFLSARQQWLPPALLKTWLLLPPPLFLLGTLLRPGFGHNVIGVATLLINTILLVWAAGVLYRQPA
ncbi:MAG: DUF2029 domain-containing protein [Chloroflexia bacterium]|nr:DUF2029 domain-containing protein [Chloroflexia bacterium]